MKIILACIMFLLLVSCKHKNQDLLKIHHDTTGLQKYKYVFINSDGDTVTRLDTSKYYYCWNDTTRYFAIVGINHKPGWWAIDRNENILFQVFNTSDGEPSPDELTYQMIRIVDDKGKIGFANYKGEIVIKPQFEIATSFYKDKAIIGSQCKKVLWCCEGENEDKHYMIQCEKTGYINLKGQVQELGNLTFEQMAKKLNWPKDE